MAEIEVLRGRVATWECDVMGHLNVGFYVAKSMQALAGLAAGLGMPRVFAAGSESTLIVREQHIRFLREFRPGSALSVGGGVVEMGETEARLLLLMRHPDGELAATFQTLVAHATSAEARAFPWPDRMRARAEALAVTVPERAAPRSLSLAAVETQASLERAEALNLVRTGLGVIDESGCDAFGRMRTEGLMHRLSDAMPHLLSQGRPGAPATAERRGGAALEYRLLHHAWPRAGDRFELRSGISGADTRTRRIVHWMLDPETGRPWASAEMVSVSFDLETRKVITLDDEELARAQAEVTPGLAL